MIFIINNLYTQIKGDNIDQSVINGIIDLCTFSHVHWFKRRATFKDITNGKAKKVGQFITERVVKQYGYFDSVNMKFPTGILYQILDYLDRNNIKYDWRDDRREFELLGIPNFDIYHILRDEYQKDAFNIMEKSGRGIINHAPNAGKTYLAMAFCEAHPMETLYIVPNKSLLQQTYDVFVEYLGKKAVGMIGDSKFKPKLYTISTIQTLWSRFEEKEVKDFLNSVKCLFIDEIHHIQMKAAKNRKNTLAFNTWYKVAMATKNAYCRFGMTATPHEERSLPRGLLECVTGHVLHKVTQSQLISWGYSVRPKIQMIKYKAEGKYDNWQTAYNELIYSNYEFNKYVADMIIDFSKNSKSVLVILTRVQTQMNILKELLPEAEFIYSNTKMKDRMQKISEFEQKKGSIIISTVFGEGVNLPSTDVLILPTGNKSDILSEQRSGRGVRLCEGKDSVLIIDFLFEGEKYTHNHSLARLNYYKSEDEFEIEIKEK